MDRVRPPSAEEVSMLEMAIDPDATSRLSSQIKVTQDLDSLVVNVPASQL
jgi:2Fe-2S ferredoxin